MQRTVTDQIQLSNLRELRARHLTAAIMQEFDRDKDTFSLREIQQVLTDVLQRNGACIETDATRRDEGKEARDGKGWTPSEWLAAHQLSVDMLFALQNITVPIESLTPPKK